MDEYWKKSILGMDFGGKKLLQPILNKIHIMATVESRARNRILLTLCGVSRWIRVVMLAMES